MSVVLSTALSIPSLSIFDSSIPASVLQMFVWPVVVSFDSHFFDDNTATATAPINNHIQQLLIGPKPGTVELPLMD
jgi:hypothetical protein